MSARNARFRRPSNRGGDNYELPLVRRCRIHRRPVDNSCVLASTTAETPKLVAKIFTTKRGRCAVDNGFAHLRVQFVGVYCRGVLVFDQLGRAMEITQCKEEFETWLALATRNPGGKGGASGDVRVVAALR